MRLGFSLYTPVFLGKPHKRTHNELIAHYESVEQFLDVLKKEGITSIEVHTLPPGAKEQDYQGVIQMIWDMGLTLTIHGAVTPLNRGSCFLDIYPSMQYVLSNFHRYQNAITMTTHAYSSRTGSGEEAELREKTIQMLKEWAAFSDAEELPLQFALENNRNKNVEDPGNNTESVLQMVQEVNNERVGICWDMGHFYANLLKARAKDTLPDTLIEDLPDDQFLKNVVHTHIHGLASNSRTHHPLIRANSLPIETYVSSLKQNKYRGVYHLELCMDRFDHDQSLGDYVIESIRCLKRIG